MWLRGTLDLGATTLSRYDPSGRLFAGTELDVAADHSESGVPQLIGQHERIDAVGSGSSSEGVPQDVGVNRLGDLGRFAQPLDQVT
jgi:hypothetical protein